MPQTKNIVCNCLLPKFKERTQDNCLNKSKEFGCHCRDTYRNHKFFLHIWLPCSYFENNFCFCKQMDADQICSSYQDTVDSLLVDRAIMTNFGIDVDLLCLNYFLERISGAHFAFGDYFNRVRCLLDSPS